MDVASGSMLFRDTFSQYNALTTLIQAGALLLFGKYLMTIKLLTAFIYACISTLLYILYKRILPSSLVSIMIFLWIFMAPYFIWIFLPWSSIYACFFLLLTAYFLIRKEESGKRPYIILSGMMASCTFWTKQSVGLLLFVAIFFLLMHQYIFQKQSVKIVRTDLLLFTTGFFFISACFILWLMSGHALHEWWIQTFTFEEMWGSIYGKNYQISHIVWNSLIPYFYYPYYIYSTRVWILIPVNAIFLFFLNTFFNNTYINKRENHTLIILIFVGLSSWPQYYPLIDFRHCYWAATPMVGLLGFSIFYMWKLVIVPNLRISKYFILPLTALCIVGILFPDIAYRMKSALKKLNKVYVSADNHSVLHGMRLTPNDAMYFSYISHTIDSFLEKDKTRNVVNLSPDALFMTFNSHIQNIHPMYVNWEPFNNMLYPEYYPLIMSYITKQKPLIVTSLSSLGAPGYCVLKNPYTLDESEISGANMANGFLAVPCSEVN